MKDKIKFGENKAENIFLVNSNEWNKICRNWNNLLITLTEYKICQNRQNKNHKFTLSF
jgi:hypothetical protein